MLKKIILVFTVLIIAACSKDNDGESSSETITVTISDFSITIDENPINEQVIGTINASTNQGSLTFSLTDENPAGAFSINSSTGELKVANASLFDYEVNPSISATVKAVNGDVNKLASIRLTINDVEEANIYDGNVILLTQEDIEEFGKLNYTEITGFLQIGSQDGNSSIVSLSPLLSLIKIGSYLTIEGNKALYSLEGLSNISFVGDKLELIQNDALVNIEALKKIDNEFKDLIIINNYNLKTFLGLHSIKRIEGLVIIGNLNLENLDSLSNLEFIETRIMISGNHNLTNISGLSKVTGVDFFLQVNNNNLLTNLTGLNNINTEIFEVSIGGESLSDISGIGHLTTIYRLRISNSGLNNLNHLTELSSVGELKINYNSFLENISGLNNIKETLKHLNVWYNESLIDFNGLQNITEIETDINIIGNNSLVNFDHFSNLGSIARNIIVSSNKKLGDFCGLQNSQIQNPTNFVSIHDNLFNPTQQDIIDGNCSL